MTSEVERDLLTDFHRHRRRREYPEAEDALAAAAASADEAAIELARGRLEFDRYDFETALTRFAKAAEHDPASDEAIAWRVAALTRLCYFEEAQLVGEEGLRAFPGSVHIGIALGRAYDEWEKPTEALASFEHVLDGRPDDEKAMEWRVYELVVLHRYSEAEAAAQDALRRCRESPGILDSVARLYAARRQYDLALDCYDRILRVQPDNEEALRERIKILRRASQRGAERTAAEDASVLLPRSADIWIQWSYLEEDEGNFQEALDLAVRAVGQEPKSCEALAQQVDVLCSLHRYGDAVEVAERATDALPRSPELMTSLAWCRSRQGLYADMLAACERALEIHDRHESVLDARATALRNLHRYTEAATAIANAVEKLPHSTVLQHEWGLLLDDQQRYEEALERFDRVLDIDPFDLVAQEWRSIELRQMRRFAEAEQAVKAVLERHPTARLIAELGSIYLDQRNIVPAVAHFQRAIEMDPSNTVPYGQLIYSLQWLHRFGAAEEVARAAIDRFPDDAYMPWYLGLVYSAQGLHERRLIAYRKAVDVDPGNAWLQGQVGLALSDMKRYSEAEGHLQDALKTWPDEPDLRRALGDMLLQQKRYDAAFEQYTMAQGGSIGEVTALRVSALRMAGRLEEAEALARDAVTRRPDIAELHIELADLYVDQARYAAAEDALRSAMRVLPDSIDLVGSLIRIYRWLGRHEEALAECDRVLAESPQLLNFERMRIGFLDLLGRYSEAKRAAADAIARNPTNEQIVVQLGWLEHELGEYGDALATFERSAEMTSTRWACYGRASVLGSLDRHVEAILLLRDELRLRPNHARTWTELADVYADTGRYDDALDAAERACRVDPYSPAAVECRLELLCRLRRWEEAERVARDALTLLPRDANLTIAMGRILDERNNYLDALVWFDRAVELKPMYNAALVAKSSTLRSLRRFAEAEQLISAAIERYPAYAFLRAELGWNYRDQGRHAEAYRVFERLREDAAGPPKLAEACVGLGWVAFTDDDYQAAARHFHQACEADEHSRDAKIGLAWALTAQEDKDGWATAERLCLDVLETRPGDLLSHTCLGVLYYQRGDYAASEHHLQRTIDLDPYDGDYVDLGALYVQLGRFAEARALLDKALERDWYDAQAHIEYGSLCLQWEGDEAEVAARTREAVRHFRQVLSINSTSVPAAIGLAIGLSRAPGDFLAAERVLRDAVNRAGEGPSRAGLLLALARLLVERGDVTQRSELYREAVTLAQEAIERAGTEAEAYFVAGVATYKLGASDAEVRTRPFYRRRAVRYLRECVGRDPGHVEGRRLLLLAQENLKTARGGAVGSAVMITLATSLLGTLWVSFFLSNRITSTVLATLTPVLVGLVALGFVLPLLVRLKLPGGVEADLSASLQQVSSGPTGDMSIGPGRIGGQGPDAMSMVAFPSGPRGQLPRLE